MGSLSLHVPLQAIALANKVKKVFKEGSGMDKTKQSKYKTGKIIR